LRYFLVRYLRYLEASAQKENITKDAQAPGYKRGRQGWVVTWEERGDFYFTHLLDMWISQVIVTLLLSRPTITLSPRTPAREREVHVYG
jgi:hypothetical protein